MITVNPDGAPNSDPDIDLTRVDGNAYAIMGAAKQAMLRAGATKEFTARYLTEAMSGDYDHLLQATIAYLDTRSV